MRAVQAASQSTAFVDNDLLMSLEKVVVHAQNAHGLASGDTTTVSRMVELTVMRSAHGVSWPGRPRTPPATSARSSPNRA
jgi:hypothetical protein